MQDFKLEQLPDTTFDIIIDEDNKIYESVSGFETTIDFQLFVDKRTTKQDISRPRDRGGWPGDIITKQNGYEVGSFIYLKQQARNTQLDRNELSGFAKNSLRYLVDIGAAKNIIAEALGNNIVGEIQIDENNIEQFSVLWENTETD